MSTITNATITAFLSILAGLGIGGGGISQLSAISGAGSGLVAHYAFDEGSGTTVSDSSGNNNTGTLTNSPIWTAGKIGSNAISFDGINDYVSVNNSSSINPSEITISVWVNPSQINNTKRVLNKGATYYIRIKNGGYPEFIGSVFLTSASVIPVNTWTHITVTGSASGHRIYLNGVLDTTSVTPYVSLAGSQPLDIGGSLDLFTGSLDDVRIYNRALSESEITELYNYTGSGGGSTPSPVNGLCGSSNNVCTTGNLSDTSDTSTLYQWSCLGSNGGTTATCSLAIPPQTPSTYTLSVTKGGTGSGTVTGGSINCGSTCSQSSISSGTQITLTATPSSGSTFTGWSGGSCSGTGTCTTTITTNTTVTATFTGSQQSSTCSSITQYGITWTFSAPVTCGQFVTGDWWVVGPVTVTTVSPGWDGSRNGSMIDPAPLVPQGFDSRINSYYPFSDSLRTKFPVTITGNKTLLSAESLAQNKIGGAYQALKSMVALTVLNSAPASNSFRPAFVSGTKKIWTTSDVNYGLVPNVAVPGGVTVPNVSNSLVRLNPYFGPSAWGTTIIPENNVTDVYPAYENAESSKLSLIAMLNTPQKQEYINRLVQRGIDHYAISLMNLDDWRPNGGYAVGLKWPIVFAGILLNDSGMKSPPLYATNVGNGSNFFKFPEDGYTYLGAPTVAYPNGKPMFGIDQALQGYPMSGCLSNCMARDPNGVWDPENNPNGGGGSYRQTVSPYWIGQTLAVYLMNAKSIWNHDLYFDYVDRWLSEPNTWTNNSDEYKSNVYGYGDGSGFIKAMWNTYRNATPPTPTPDTTSPSVSLTSPSNNSTVSGSVSISATASDNIGVIGVQWKLDGVNLGSELTTAPYSGTWNTGGVSNGTHTLTATARDLAGNTKVSSIITVTVSNTAPTTPITPTTPTTNGGGTTSSNTSSGGGGGSSSSPTTSLPSTGTLTPTVPQRPASGGGGGSSSTRPTTGTGTTVSSQPTSQLAQLIELFISLGIIKPDKVSAARAFIASSQNTITTTSTGTGKFTLALDIGARNTEVTALQNYLISQNLLFTKATGYFGPATAKAVGLFQQKYNLAQPGSPAYGFVGPKTRAKLNEVVK